MNKWEQMRVLNWLVHGEWETNEFERLYTTHSECNKTNRKLIVSFICYNRGLCYLNTKHPIKAIYCRMCVTIFLVDIDGIAEMLQKQ